LAADVAVIRGSHHEEATHAKLTALLADGVFAIAEHGGYMKNTGDGF
jgi:hypothetical protein